MQTLRMAALALLALSLTGAAARACSYPATPESITPTHFHWTVQPANSPVRSYHFDSRHGWWNATLTQGDVTVEDHGVIPVGSRLSFYQGLAANGAWSLATNGKGTAGVQYSYVVTQGKDEHCVSFTASPSPDYDKLVTYVDGTLVGQEEKTLEARLSSLPAPAAFKP